MHWPLITDEGGYAYTAYWWFKGFQLYSDQLWFDRPQGIFLAYKLGMTLLGTQTWAIRLWGALWASGTSVFVYLITKHLSNDRTALVASMIYAIFSAMPQIEGFTSNAEVFALLPATASIYCLLIGRFSLAGLLASLAFLLKPSGGSVIIFGLIWIMYNKSAWQLILKYLFFTTPLLILALVHGAFSSSMATYIYATVFYRFGINSNSYTYMINNLQNAIFVCLPLFILLLFGLPNLENKNKTFLMAWLISSFIGISLGKIWHMHYFIQAIPTLAFGAAFGLMEIWRKKRFYPSVLLLLLIIFPIISSISYLLYPPEEAAWRLYHRTGYTIANEVANYINDNTNPDDKIYVAFAEAEIYYLSERQSSIPFIYLLDLLNYPGAYSSLILSIKNNVPVYVVALDPPITSIDPENRFQQALDENYYIETYIKGTPIYKRKALTPSE